MPWTPTILDKIKWNSKLPSPPNQGWSRAKGKNAPFSHLWFGGRGGGGGGLGFHLFCPRFQLVMHGHYNKTANQSARTIVAIWQWMFMTLDKSIPQHTHDATGATLWYPDNGEYWYTEKTATTLFGHSKMATNPTFFNLLFISWVRLTITSFRIIGCR